MTDPHSPTRISATVKVPESAKFKGDNPWLVFEASNAETLKQLIIDGFAMNGEAESLSLFEVLVEAEKTAVGVSTAIAGLGGTVINKGGGSAWAKAGQQQSSEPAEPAAPEKSEEEQLIESLTAQVQAVTDVPALQRLWAENQEAFKNDDLMAEYKKRGQALSAG